MVFLVPLAGRTKTMIKIKLNEQEKLRLEKTRQSFSENSEKR